MKKLPLSLTADDVRDILDDTLRETGLDQVPKRLNMLYKIMSLLSELD